MRATRGCVVYGGLPVSRLRSRRDDRAVAETQAHRAIELLEQGQPIYYTGSHSGTSGGYESG
jgi:hypothetical protein